MSVFTALPIKHQESRRKNYVCKIKKYINSNCFVLKINKNIKASTVEQMRRLLIVQLKNCGSEVIT